MPKTQLVNLKNEIIDTITDAMLNLQELRAKYDTMLDDMISKMERTSKKVRKTTKKSYSSGIRNPWGRSGNDISSRRADAMEIIGFDRTTKFNDIKHIDKYRKAFWKADSYLRGRTSKYPKKVR